MSPCENDTPINWKRNLIVAWLGCFLTGAAFSLVMPFLPLYVEQLGVTGRPEYVVRYCLQHYIFIFGHRLTVLGWTRRP